MPAIVEAKAGPSIGLRPCLDLERLGAFHVRTVAAQEHDSRRASLDTLIGNVVTVANRQMAGLRHVRHP